MLAVILKIISIIGMILLILLAVLLFVLFLVLFMPIVYRVDAKKEGEQSEVWGRVRWLFGFFRVSIQYPEPNRVRAKVLWFTLFDSARQKQSGHRPPVQEKRKKAVEENVSEAAVCAEEKTEAQPKENGEEQEQIPKKKIFFAKYEKIKYTLQSIYDKIKHIWENMSFYRRLLQDEATQELFGHVCRKLSRILKHIRPSKVKADIIFGAASPDTTGYVFGIYCMFSSKFGKDVCVVPDFEHEILQGNLHFAGHITLFKLLIYVLAILMDKRLQLFIQRIKKHSENLSSREGME